MKFDSLNHNIWTSYPFPIAYAHKKTIETVKSDNKLEKLKSVTETAEVLVRFLSLLSVAQVHQDILNDKLPELCRFNIKLDNPTFGRWQYIPLEIMKKYRGFQDRLAMPELYVIYGHKSRVLTQLIDPLRNIRNHFAHGLIPESQFELKAAESLELLHQLIEATHFLTKYQLACVEKVTVEQDNTHRNVFIHDLKVLNSCFTPFGKDYWHGECGLPKKTVVLIRDNMYLRLDPFVIFTDHFKGLPDLCVLINFAGEQPVYVSTQYGENLSIQVNDWNDGKEYQKKIRLFFRKLRSQQTSEIIEPDHLEKEVLISLKTLREIMLKQRFDLHISDKIPDYIVNQAIKGKQSISACYEELFYQPFMQRLRSGQFSGYDIITASIAGDIISFTKRTADQDQTF